jgi:hypothetical protein
MAFPTIQINSSTGSDTQASGAGPASALFGTSASFAGSVFTLDGSPDLSGVATDGSAVIWADTTSGRQFFTINAKDNTTKTVTVDDAPAGTSTGRTWGIGGKRLNLDAASNRTLFATTVGAKTGWIIDLQNTASHVLTSSLGIQCIGAYTGYIKICTVTGSPALVTTATNSTNLFNTGNGQYIWMKNLRLSNTAGTRARGIAALNNSTLNHVFEDLELDGFTTGVAGEFITNFAFYGCQFINVEVKNCSSHGFDMADRGNQYVNVYSHDNGGNGFLCNAAQVNGGILDSYAGCSFSRNTGRGYYLQYAGVANRHSIFRNCIFYSNTSSGLEVAGTTARQTVLQNCIVYGNGVSGVIVPGDGTVSGGYNAYGSNSSGDRSGFSAQAGDVSLSGDPFTNAASDDYSLNNTAGAGAACRAVGFPGVSNFGTGHLDIGAFQHLDGGGGGGAFVF